MTTTKSFSENRFGAFYKKSLRAQMPFAIALVILLILLIPVSYFTQTVGRYSQYAFTPDEFLTWIKAEFDGGVFTHYGFLIITMVFIGIFALASALVSNSYMHSKSQVDLYHSLPVTRKNMLTANLLAAFTAHMVPFGVIYLFTMVCQLIGFGKYGCFGPSYFQSVIVDLLTTSLYFLVVYVFTTFICVQVGTVLDALMITGVIGFMLMFLYAVCGAWWASSTFGAVFDDSNVAKMLLLSPFSFVYYRFAGGIYRNNSHVSDISAVMQSSALWVVIGGILLVATVVLYDRRKSEIAGLAQSQGVLQTIVKCFAALCGAILMLAIFWDASLTGQMVGMLLGAVVIGIIAELIFSRGARYVKKNIKWMLSGGVLACLLLLGINNDVIGYVHNVPKVEEVASARVRYKGRFTDLVADGHDYYNSYSDTRGDLNRSLTDPDSIAVLVGMHQKAVDNIPPEDWEERWADGTDQYLHPYINLSYELKNGKTVTRRYGEMYAEAYALLAELEDKDDFISGVHPVFLLDNLPGISQVDVIGRVGVTDPYQIGVPQNLNLNQDSMRRLLDAVQQDLRGETLAEIMEPTVPAVGYLVFNYKGYSALRDRYGNEGAERIWDAGGNEQTVVLITPEYTNTMAFLRQFGVLGKLEEVPVPDKLYIADLGNTGIPEANRVVTVPCRFERNTYADEVYSYLQSGSWDWVKEGSVRMFEITDSREIEAIDAVSINQGYMDNEMLYNTMAVIAEKDGVVCGHKFVRVDDLPLSRKEKVTAYLEELRVRRIDNVYGDGARYTELPGAVPEGTETAAESVPAEDGAESVREDIP